MVVWIWFMDGRMVHGSGSFMVLLLKSCKDLENEKWIDHGGHDETNKETKRRIGDTQNHWFFDYVTNGFKKCIANKQILTLWTLDHPVPNQKLYLQVKSFDVQFPDFLVSRLLVDYCNHFEC